MKLQQHCKWLLIPVFALFLVLLGTAGAGAYDVDAGAAILIDAESGKILYQKNASQPLPPASTTKILTALIALEKGTLDQVIEVPAGFVNVGEAGIDLQAGEKHTLKDLLYAMLLRSANDAAQVIAIGIAGSENAFVEMMNTKTTNMGLTQSTWKNVHGLYTDGHMVSAHDMAMIARAAMKNEDFRTIVAAKEWEMPWEGNNYNRELNNRNQFLTTYEGAEGIQSGQTTQSGACLVAAATKNDYRLIGVLFNCPNVYTEMADMMDWGFDKYVKTSLGTAGESAGTVKVVDGWEREVNAVYQTSPYMLFEADSGQEATKDVQLNASIDAPVKKGDVLGKVVFTDGLGTKMEVPVVAEKDVALYSFLDIIKAAFGRIFGVLFD